MPTLPSYVLVTPARNEASFIRLTLESVVAQTVRPLRWVIVSDGSTDRTDEIVREFAARHEWIELLRTPERKERHFAGKVNAFNAGYSLLRTSEFDCVGSLDADISFDSAYFEFLLSRLEENPKLGLVGTPFREGKEMYDYRFVSLEHVSGACQLFRRTCFEDIGGYTAVKGGGVDHIAVLTARMKGWQTRTFPEKVTEHHRSQGSAQRGVLWAKWHVGTLDYALGGHPLWEMFRGAYQMTKRPFLIGGLLILGGYVSAMLRGHRRAVSDELMAFRRHEQMTRLKDFVASVPGSIRRAVATR